MSEGDFFVIIQIVPIREVNVMNGFKKVGKEVLMISTGKDNLRNGEGSFIRLKNGDILHIYTAYFGDSAEDHASAKLCGVISSDEGESFNAPFVVLEMAKDAQNVMSVSLLRMGNGDIGLFYIEKYARADAIVDRYLLVRSSDEGKTWSAPTHCIDDGDYYVINNDRVVMLSNGNIIIPAAYHQMYTGNAASHFEGKGRGCYFVSRDDGRSFEKLDVDLVSPFIEISKGLQEPGVYQFEDGRLWTWYRTNLGFQFEAFSDDGGKSWSELRPNLFFTSPRSPLQVKRAGKYTVAVFNPIPRNAATLKRFGMDRTPLMLSVSEDGGATFVRSYLLEDDPDNAYSYPAIIEGEDYLLVSYYYSNGGEIDLNSTKITKVRFEEIAD